MDDTGLKIFDSPGKSAKIILIALLLLSPGCVLLAPELRTLRITDSEGAIVVDIEKLHQNSRETVKAKRISNAEIGEYANTKFEIFYIVPKHRLKALNFSKSLTYLGTEEGFHLLRLWSVYKSSKDQILRFATNDCVVSESRSVFEEFIIYNANYRNVILDENGCRVL